MFKDRKNCDHDYEPYKYKAKCLKRVLSKEKDGVTINKREIIIQGYTLIYRCTSCGDKKVEKYKR